MSTPEIPAMPDLGAQTDLSIQIGAADYAHALVRMVTIMRESPALHDFTAENIECLIGAWMREDMDSRTRIKQSGIEAANEALKAAREASEGKGA